MLKPAPTLDHADIALWRKRLRYRSEHRGCKETDLVLGAYGTAQLETLDEADLHRFEAFLNEDDADIWNWLVEKTPCPNPDYAELLAALRRQRLA